MAIEVATGGSTQGLVGEHGNYAIRVLLLALVFGTLSTTCGGYVAARVGAKGHYVNAAAVGVAGVVIGIFSAADYPLWFNAVGFALVIPAALLGGHIAKGKLEGAIA